MSSSLNSQPWWVERWLEILDSYRFKKRLERARIYAREGNVLSIKFVESEVKAEVQGSEELPYLVSMSLPCFTQEDWSGVLDSLAEKAFYRAALLFGEMPEEIEAVFTINGLNIFPYTLAEVESSCSCPDKMNPCKHIGALYYQIAERFAEDPFILFQLRGKSKDEILAGIRFKKESDVIDIPTISKPADLIGHPKNFWSCFELSLADLRKKGNQPFFKSNTLKVLNRMPLPQEEADALEIYLKQVYQKCSELDVGRISIASPKE